MSSNCVEQKKMKLYNGLPEIYIFIQFWLLAICFALILSERKNDNRDGPKTKKQIHNRFPKIKLKKKT